MSIDQTKKIKAAVQEETKFKSIRLTQAHRKNILDSVMKQWEVINPKPVTGTFIELIRQMFVHYYQRLPKKAPPEYRGLSRVINNTVTTKTFVNSLPENCRELLKVEQVNTFNACVILADGSSGATYIFRLPKALADEWGIPYLTSRKTLYFNHSPPHPELREYFTYTKEQDRWEGESVFFASKSSFIAFSIPYDFPALRSYKEGQKQITDWEKERERQVEEVLDYLNQYNTTNQLREHWPEVVPYLPPHIADPERVIQLPALAKSRLNERLGL